jgi:hypothetical protein
MNENHTHDKALLREIERRLTEGRPTGDPLLDELAGTLPRADAGFQADLEQRLLARLDIAKSSTPEEPARMTANTLSIDTPTRRGPSSLTMAAAVMAVLVIVGLLVFMTRIPAGPEPFASGIIGIDQDDTPPGADESLLQETATETQDELLLQATAVIATATARAADEDTLMPAISGPLVPVVITLGEILPGQLVDADALAVTWWPPEIVPAGVYGDPHDLIGLYAAGFIAAYQPLTESRLAESLEDIGRTILLTPTVVPPTDVDAIGRTILLTPTVVPPTVVPPEALPVQATPTPVSGDPPSPRRIPLQASPLPPTIPPSFTSTPVPTPTTGGPSG